MLTKLLLVLTSVAFKFHQINAFTPISSFEQTVIYNGVPTTERTLTGVVTESDPFGSFKIGDYNLNISTPNPHWNFQVTEIGTIPRRTRLVVNKNCLVNDVYQYSQSVAKAQAQVGLNSTAIDNGNGNTASNARALQFLDPVATALSVAALVKSQQALNEVHDLKDQFQGFIAGSYQQTLNAVGDLKSATTTLKGAVQTQQAEISLVQNSTNILFQQQQQQQYELNVVNNTINAIAAETKKSFTQLNTQLTAYSAQVASQFDSTQAQTRDAFIALTNNMMNITSQLQLEIDALIREDLNINSIFNNLLVGLSTQMRNLQQDRNAVKSYFKSLDTMDPAFFPFTLGQGIRPGGSLVGVDKRFLVEKLDLNWVGPTIGSGASSRYQIYNSQIRFYFDTIWALDNAQYFTGVNGLMMLLASPNCQRAYSDADSKQEGGLPACKFWVEIRTYACTSANVSPKFAYQLDGNTSIPLNYCQSTPTLDPRYSGPHVIKDFNNLVSFYQTDICTQMDGRLKITTSRTQGQQFHTINQPLCLNTWKLQKYYAETQNNTSIQYKSLVFVNAALSPALLDLFAFELKVFGRNPGGLKYEKKPNDYVPVGYNGTKPLYDGGAKPVDCTYTSWLAVDKLTVPLLSISPIANPLVSKSIHVSIDGPTCIDPSQCYPVGEGDITSNIELSVDSAMTIPGSFIMAGYLDDWSQGIWDIPSRSLSGSAQTQERANTPGYILMPPGTRNTDDLPAWIGRNTDLFEPTSGAVSAGLYRFSASYDDQNAPYCAVQNAIPQSQFPVTQFGCISPFQYGTDSDPVYQNPIYPAECANVPASILYADYQSELQLSSIDTSINSALAQMMSGSGSYSISFLYRHEALLGSFGALTVLGTYANSGPTQFVQFGISPAGVPIVQMNNWDSSSAYSSNLKVQDGLFHMIQWSVSYDNSNFVFALNLDGVPFGNVSNAANNFTSSQPFVRRLSDLSPTSQDAQVALLTVYNQRLTSKLSGQLFECALSDVGFGRCAADDEQIIFARQNVTFQNNTQCSQVGTLLQSKHAFDQQYPITFNPATLSNPQQSFTLFFKAGSIPLSSNNPNLLQINTTSVFISLDYIGGTQVSLSINSNVMMTLNIMDSVSHFLAFTYDTSSKQFIVWQDLILIQTFFNVQAQNPGVVAFTAHNPNVWMLKAYPAILLSADVQNEAQCQISPTLGINNFLPPIGYCNLIPGTIYGYCRQPTLCSGHCQAYSIIDVNTGTFSTVVNECDAGFSAPDCLVRCARQDPITGYCLDSSSNSASGLIPGSQICNMLKFNRPLYSPSTKTLSLSPRKWEMTVTLQIPTGAISQVINTGSCPAIAIDPAIDGSYMLTLTNNDDINSIVAVTYAPDDVFSGTRPCNDICCVLNTDQTTTVPSHARFVYSVPSAGCGNMTIIVSQPLSHRDPYTNATSASFKECSRLSGAEVNALVSTAFNQPVSAAVQSSIYVGVNEAALGIRRISAALGDSVSQLFAIAANVDLSSDDFKVILQAQRQQFANISYTTPILNTTALPNFDVSAQLDQLNQVVSDSNEKAIKAAQQFQQNNRLITNASDIVNDFLNKTDHWLVQTQVALVAAQQGADITLTNLENMPDNSDFLPGFNTLLKGVVDVAVAAESAAKTVGDGLLDVVGGLGGGIFAKLIKMLVDFLLPFIIVVGGGYAVYFIYEHSGKHKPKTGAALDTGDDLERPKKKKSTEDDDEYAKTSLIGKMFGRVKSESSSKKSSKSKSSGLRDYRSRY